MILTDGKIEDKQQTIDSLYEAGELPFSVIIVGIGNYDFELMKELDADRKVLKNSKGQAFEKRFGSVCSIQSSWR